MFDFNILKELNKILLARGSWLYDEENSNLDLETFFIRAQQKFNAMTPERKFLVLHEISYCRIEPFLLKYLYKAYCNQYNESDLYDENGQTMLETIENLTADDLKFSDIHNPQLWCRETGKTKLTCDSHEVILFGLESMTPELQNQLMQIEDPLLKKRILYLKQTMELKSLLILPNEDPMFDRVDDELLNRIDTFDSDVKARYGTVRLLSEDIHDELDSKHKQERLTLVKLLYNAIETLDLETLKELPMFENARIEHFVDIKKHPKDWLYKEIHDLVIKRDLCKLRGVEFHQ